MKPFFSERDFQLAWTLQGEPYDWPIKNIDTDVEYSRVGVVKKMAHAVLVEGQPLCTVMEAHRKEWRGDTYISTSELRRTTSSLREQLFGTWGGHIYHTPYYAFPHRLYGTDKVSNAMSIAVETVLEAMRKT